MSINIFPALDHGPLSPVSLFVVLQVPQQKRATESARTLLFVVAAGRTAGSGENGESRFLFLNRLCR